MTRAAWFHCFAGIAGDMALGSVIDAGADVDEIRAALETLPFSGWSLSTSRVLRGGISATHAVVSVDDDGVARTASAITAMIEAADLPTRVTERSLAVFAALAAAEGSIHQRPASEVHLHEVGGHDAIVDVVGTMLGLELLGIDVIYSSTVAMGQGTIRSHHGMIPNPPPAVLALLRDAPIVGRAIELELTTPTGAAILGALASGFGPIPPLTVTSTGYGAGTREIDGLPNATQVVIGTLDSTTERLEGQPLVVIEANLDDATGEQVADTIEALFAAGAADAWITPVVMKKGRPGQVVTALCDARLTAAVRDILLGEGGSFGVRTHAVERFATERQFSTVVIDGHAVAVKSNGYRAKVEHDDAARAAAALGLTVRAVTARALAAYDDGRSGPDA